MKLHHETNRRARGRRWTAAAALAGFLALGVATLDARAPDPRASGGGGDAIGSLPFTAPQHPEQHVGGGTLPSIVLQAPSLQEIHEVVLDAYGEGYAELFDLAGGGVRVELQGRVTLVVDRNVLAAGSVAFGLDATQGFQSGLALIEENGRVVRTQALPANDDLEIPLQTLADSGVLDSGGLTVHSVSLIKKHHRLDLVGSGATIRLDSHP